MNRQGIWDFWAGYYDRLWLQKVSLQPTRILVSRRISEIFATKQGRAGLNILDMGCGTGQQYGDLVESLGAAGFQYTGVDQSGAMIDRAKAKFPEADFLHSDVLRATPEHIPFDVIICSHSFPYYTDGESALARMAELLKPGGSLLLTQACKDRIYDALILKLTGLTTSTACYRSSRQMLELGEPLFQQADSFRISEKFFVPSLYLFQWVA